MAIYTVTEVVPNAGRKIFLLSLTTGSAHPASGTTVSGLTTIDGIVAVGGAINSVGSIATDLTYSGAKVGAGVAGSFNCIVWGQA